MPMNVNILHNQGKNFKTKKLTAQNNELSFGLHSDFTSFFHYFFPVPGCYP